MEFIKITLEAARRNVGLTQKQVAELLNVSVQSVCAWEKEPYKITIGNAIKLAELYHISIDNLIFMAE